MIRTVFLFFSILILAIGQGRPAPQPDGSSPHNRAGRAYLDKHEWKSAAEEFEYVIKLNPRSVDAYIGLGIARWGLRDRDGALSAFEKATAVDPKSAEAHYDIALAFKDLGESERTEKELRAALRLRPPYDEAELMLGLLLQQTGRPDDAIAQYKHLLKRNPRSAEAHNWLGVSYLQKNALTEAEAEFRQAIKLKPDYARAYNNLGSTLAQAGEIVEGIEILQTGLKYASQDVQLRINLGMALRTKGDGEGALAMFESLAREQPDNPELLYQIGQTLRQNGDLPGAIQNFEKALALSPEAREVYYGLGQALKQTAAEARRKSPAQKPDPAAAGEIKAGTQALVRGDLAAARSAFEKAIASAPESADAYNLMGFTIGRSGDLPSAIEKLNRAVTLDPNLAEAHYNLGVALWYSADRAKSAAELDEALILDPSAADAYAFRGTTMLQSGDLDRARQMLQRAIALNSQAPVPYFDLALVFLRKGQVEHAQGQLEAGLNLPPEARGRIPDLNIAIDEFRKAIANSQDADSYNILARLLGLADAPTAELVAALENAIRLRPDFAAAYNNLGLVYVQSGDDERAVAAFRKAIDLQPGFADAHQNVGAVLTTSDPAEAVRELEKAVSLEPRLLKAQYNLAIAYDVNPAFGPAKAVEQLQRLLAMDARYPRAEFVLGRTLLRQGKIPDAVEHLGRAVEQEPDYGEARYQYGLALSRSGERAEGATQIQKGRELIAANEKEQAGRLDLAEARDSLENGKPDEAIPKIQRVIKNWPNAAEPYALLGVALEKKGTPDALGAYRKALEIDPTNAQAKSAIERLTAPRPSSAAPAAAAAANDPERLDAAEELIRREKFDAAERLLRSFLEEHPKSSWGWYAMGYSLYGQRKLGESIKALAQCLQLDVNYADAHKLLGRNMMIIGRFDAAKVEFETGARLDPHSAEMPYNLGKMYSITDNWPDAKSQFESAVRIDPSYMEAWDGLGLALESLGKDEEAIATYKKAIALNETRNGSFASPYVNLSSLSNRTGKHDMAMEYAQKALEVNPRSDGALFQMAKVYEYRGDFPAAADALNNAIAINARVSSYFYVLGTIHRKMGNSEESRNAMLSFRNLERESNDLEQKRRSLGKQQQKKVPEGDHD